MALCVPDREAGREPEWLGVCFPLETGAGQGRDCTPYRVSRIHAWFLGVRTRAHRGEACRDRSWVVPAKSLSW